MSELSVMYSSFTRKTFKSPNWDGDCKLSISRENHFFVHEIKFRKWWYCSKNLQFLISFRVIKKSKFIFSAYGEIVSYHVNLCVIRVKSQLETFTGNKKVFFDCIDLSEIIFSKLTSVSPWYVVNVIHIW